jgi:hypothetical protein
VSEGRAQTRLGLRLTGAFANAAFDATMNRMPDVSACKRVVGRYEILGAIASGGMATVHFGRLVGPAGFSRLVAIKELHPHLAKDPEFASMLVDEARLAAHVRHPNVVPTLDVVVDEGALLLVMEYVAGASLAELQRASVKTRELVPLPITVTVMSGALYGLHAAHEAKNERNEPLGVVHRDVSPQNILVGTDGVPRVLDFGVAKAASRLVVTRDGQVKGKLAYMAPEQLMNEQVDRRVDVYAAGVILWEALTGGRLFEADDSGGLVRKVLNQTIVPPSRINSAVPEALDAVIMRSLERDKEARFRSAHAMAEALESTMRPATAREVGAWVERMGGSDLVRRAEQAAETVGSVVTAQIAASPSMPGGSGVAPITSLSAVTPSRLTARGGGAQRGLRSAGALLALVLVSGVVLLRARARELASAAPVTAPVPSVTPPLPVPSTPTSMASSVATPGDAAAPSVPISSTASSTVSTHAPPSKPARPRVATPNASAPTGRSVDCSPPYTIDSEGLKVYKPQCLR